MPNAVIVLSFMLRAALFAALLGAAACSEETSQSLVASGNAYFAKSEYSAAAVQYKAALQRDPRSSEARRQLGRTLMIAGDVDGALVELTKVLEDKTQTPQVLPLLSRALVLAGEYNKLVTTYGDVTLEDKAGQAELKTNVAIAWGGLGKLSKVATAVDAALQAMPDFAPAIVVKARYVAAKGQFDEAAALLDGVVARHPKAHEAWLLRGEILEYANRDRAAAEASYRKAVEADPNYVQAHAAIIASRLRESDLAGAKVQAGKLRTLLPKHPYTTLVGAQIAIADRQPAQAREQLQLLLRAFPEHPYILMLSGVAEAQLGAATQAAAYLGKALRYEPTLKPARRSLAEIEIRQGQPTDALKTLKPLLDAPQADSETYSLAGDAHIRLRNPAAAEKYYLLAAKAEPENLRFQAAAAMTRLSRGDVAAALSDLQSISAKAKDTYADEVLFAARLRRREYDAALATLDAMFRKRPGQAALFELQGQVHLARRDNAAARASFEQATKADPALFAAVSSLARLDVAEGRAAQAIARLRENTKLNPANAAAWLSLAELSARHGTDSIGDIRATFAEAIKVAPLAPEPRIQLIEFLLKKNLFKDALAAAQSAAAALPGDVLVLDALGQTQMRAGDLEQAATTFRKLAIAVPTSPEPYMRLAELYGAAGKHAQAESALHKAIEVDAAYVPAQVALADLLVLTSRNKDALAHVRKIQQANPTQTLGYLLEAIYHGRRKDEDAAVSILREGVAKTKHSELASRLYAQLLKAKREAEADKFGVAWLRDHPKDANFEYLVSVTDMSRKDYKSAEARLRRVLTVQPDNVAALNNLGWLLATAGDSGALAFAQRAADMAPNQASVLDTLALALVANKQTAAALDVQRRAVELAPKEGQLRLNLAKLALTVGDKALARRELQQVQELGGAFPAQDEVRKLLQGL